MIGDLEVEIPDLVEPIVAWRAFALRGDVSTPILTSINGTMWPPNGTGKRPFHEADFITAVCKVNPFVGQLVDAGLVPPPDEDHQCPCSPKEASGHVGMGCGIYAYKSIPDLAWDFPLKDMKAINPLRGNAWDPVGIIWGEVELWGHVYDHDKGYRAQHARMKSLLLLPGYGVSGGMTRQVAQIYGVELIESALDVEEMIEDLEGRFADGAFTSPAPDIMWMIVCSIGSLIKKEIVSWAKKARGRIGRDRKANKGRAIGGTGPSTSGTNP